MTNKMSIDKAGIRVLVVDDWEEWQGNLSLILNLFGYEQIKTAADSFEALTVAREYHPHLVLIETNIPGYGPSVCSQMRHEDYGRSAAIIGTTHPPLEPDPILEANWLLAGADDFFSKDMLTSEEGRNNLDAIIQKALAKHHMQQIVGGEIGVYRQRYGDEEALNQYLSNFYRNLPTDTPENMSSHRNVAAKLGVLDKTHEEYYDQESKDGSELWRKQTFGEFFRTIDIVLEELKIPLRDIIRLQTLTSRVAVDSDGVPAITKLNQLVLPAYIRLRESGYNRYPDLVR